LRGDLLLRHTRATRRGLRTEEQAHNRAVRARAGPTLRQRLCALRALAREQTLRERAAAGVQARDVAVALRGQAHEEREGRREEEEDGAECGARRRAERVEHGRDVALLAGQALEVVVEAGEANRVERDGIEPMLDVDDPVAAGVRVERGVPRGLKLVRAVEEDGRVALDLRGREAGRDRLALALVWVAVRPEHAAPGQVLDEDLEERRLVVHRLLRGQPPAGECGARQSKPRCSGPSVRAPSGR
jgi:hypothetical protein